MSVDKIAITHPGKYGDMLYCLPAAKALCEINGCKADFYTSQYCSGLKNLFEYQPYIDSFQVSPEHRIQNMGAGVQPWMVPVPSGYKNTYHLGFRQPPGNPLPDYMCDLYSLPHSQITLDVPDFPTLDEPYIVINPRGDVDFLPHYKDFFSRCPVPVVCLGARHEYPGFGLDMTGLDFLESATWIKKSRGFVGISAMFVIADAFPIPKVVLSRLGGLDGRHLTQYGYTYYMNRYDYSIIRNFLDMNQLNTLSKTMVIPEDYNQLSGYCQHIMNIADVVHNIGRFEHEHRKWEYGMAYKAVDITKSLSVLDVGGGGSIFAPAMAWIGVDVTTIDPGDVGAWIKQQGDSITKNLKFIQQDFMAYTGTETYDMVCSLSVIEHVPNDIEFIQKMGKNVKDGGYLMLSFDFHPSGNMIVNGHIRTYNSDSIKHIINVMEKEGFSVFGGTPNYKEFDPKVNGCTFATLLMRKG